MSYVSDKYAYLINVIRSNIKDRELVIWGTNAEFENFYKQEYGIKSIKNLFFTDSIVDNKKFFGMSILKGNVNKYFVVNFDIDPRDVAIKKLESMGYKANLDYALFKHVPKLCRGKGNYCDEFNNKVLNCPENCDVIFDGANCEVIFDEGITVYKKIRLYFAQSACTVKIGKKTLIGGSIEMLGSNIQISIGDNCMLRNFDCFFYKDVEVKIGKGTTTSMTGLRMVAHPNCNIEIGTDCMFSTLVAIWGGDGHTIYDVKTGEIINNDKNIIKIGNHVWIGTQAIIMAGADVGAGSIIGARSLVNKKYPNNVTIAGSPARVLRKNVAWTRKLTSNDIRDCGIENINFTEDFNND